MEIRFDDLSGDYTPWEITIVHCDRHWTPSDLHPSEYLQGFYTTPMEDDEASFGTKVDFTVQLDTPVAGTTTVTATVTGTPTDKLFVDVEVTQAP